MLFYTTDLSLDQLAFRVITNDSAKISRNRLQVLRAG